LQEAQGMRLLIIEDDKKTVSYLRKGLSENGFVVDVGRDGEEGLYLATRLGYDLLILDLLLPVRDGWSVLCELRREGRQTPVLLLSALGGVTSRVKGLRLGADDYLVKPFAFSELLARISSILRRGQTQQEETLRISDLELDIPRHKAFRQGKRLDLTPKEFQLLALLARRPGEVFSRTVIAEQVWDMNFDSDTNVVDVHIRRLRSKLDDPFEKKLICTVRGLGYVLEGK
jgi:two-component system, OmpR family, copper resistance phosphate regulon response regulator CusR